MSAGIRPRACRSCGVEVYDLRHVRTGKTAPIEVRLSPGGNIAVDLATGHYSNLTAMALTVARAAGVELRVSHFVSCPSATSWRERSRRKAG